ncbi:hypothetical protein C8Q76DRAFT_325834 [Earliella scabrosa]|nr:hypothetical protein C8Q76DRAFT_325834 [Earliella scabrosa]
MAGTLLTSSNSALSTEYRVLSAERPLAFPVSCWQVVHALGLRRDVRTAGGRRDTSVSVDDAHGGENLPLEILRPLSVGSCRARYSGARLGYLAAFEDSLSALERILTTPLPFL